ncbi:tRNA uridine-5-carboxymethylaminomethyl(34) synthesis GTPase MnmE [Paracoccus sp. (in: a-proteobacteria)]|uniref:tRNA uridine-5-carboxymethylaminomethyl(34) synthesis GTPase MnmE n=1 Tax=Paracoccus sp. TaxID=267 RepID=UPI0026DF16D8|nr:tRNA uridine-5-carboxymethylaminomethyl(34) synthesis GTPase MnmE [Paracoccus sp. (in: a-proteobacteria)]MDO5647499.1 tRNA uridine-5-carboxymethylaminomethyl(34) synthesis GTPase MnmE [Paracoccus sp. (in: a-proteobacteria)]
MDVIFAEASPPGRGGVSVIRLSGRGCRAIAERLAGPLPVARHAYFRVLRDGGEELDQALVLWFAEGASFTGEEVVELHLHGAPVVVRRVGAALRSCGARDAEAGDFTRRAFLNGRMDLAEIEGLGDLLAAETEMQRKQALRAAGGALARKADQWRAALIHAGAMIEVSVDFADEEVPDDVAPEVYEQLAALRGDLARELAGFSAAERIRQGFEVAVVGPPNAGKSQLINRIAGRELAIVSDIAGTTRDVIELRADLRGLAVTFLDTAGLRVTGDDIEAIGVQRAKDRAAAADLRIHLHPEGVRQDDLWCDGDLVLVSQDDGGVHNASVSSVSGHGIDRMLDMVYDRLADRVAGAGIISHERQRAELSDAVTALSDLDDLPVELLAENVRQAASSLDRLVGRIGAEDYLDVIFSSFCIGK